MAVKKVDIAILNEALLDVLEQDQIDAVWQKIDRINNRTQYQKIYKKFDKIKPAVLGMTDVNDENRKIFDLDLVQNIEDNVRTLESMGFYMDEVSEERDVFDNRELVIITQIVDHLARTIKKVDTRLKEHEIQMREAREAHNLFALQEGSKDKKDVSKLDEEDDLDFWLKGA